MNKQVKPGELPLPTSAERITTPPAADAIKKEVVAKANAMLAEDFGTMFIFFYMSSPKPRSTSASTITL
jgi:hypothetical protein